MLKHLLVHVDASARAEERLDLAVTLARRFGAQLNGLFSESPTIGPSIVGRRDPAEIAKAMASARALFESKADAAGVVREWWEIEGGDYAHVVGWTVVCSRYVDLSVFGQVEGDQVDRLPGEIVEQVLLDSGRPLLVVPAFGHYPDVGHRVLIAWTGSREAARAVNDALPLIVGAEEVNVLSIQQPSVGYAGGPAPHVDIVAHLRAHGVDARYERLILDDIGVVDHVLNRAADWNADLTVIGGYGQRGFPYLQRSNTTRDILRTMTTPVLLSH